MRKIIFSEEFEARRSEVLSILDQFHSQAGEQVGNQDRNELKVFPFGNININIKSFKVPNFLNQIVYKWFRPSKAKRSFNHAYFLSQHGIGTPKPIAYIEESTVLFFKKSYFISEHIGGDVTYRTLVLNEDFPDRKHILQQFTIFTHLLHKNRVLFKDHSPGNTLITFDCDQINFYLVDLNRMNFKSLSFDERIKNFSRLSPHKEMVQIMSEQYAKCTGENYELIFNLMWKYTSEFQARYFRKKRLKEKYLFWRKK